MNVSYYPGCSLDGTAREYGESVETVCKALGVELEELKDWNCCGASSAHVVDNGLAIALSARNLEIAGKAGKDLIVPCAACYNRLKVAQKELQSGKTPVKYNGFRIKHAVDFLWEDVGEKAIGQKVKNSLEKLNPVCYYGCLTVRPPAVTDAAEPEDPRAMDCLLASMGAHVRNWSFKTDCCGGSLILTRPAIAHRLVSKLLDMTQEAGADCIVVGCPMCFSNLDTPQKAISQEAGRVYNVPIIYITELMGIAFGEPSAKKWLGRHITDPRPLLRQKGLI